MMRASLTFLGEALPQPGDDGVGAEPFVLALGEGLEDDEVGREVGAVGLLDEGDAGQPDRMGDALVGANDLLDARGNFLRAVEAGGVGQLHADDEPAHVLLRHEPARRVLKHRVGQNQEGAVGQDHDRAELQRAADDPAISVGQTIEAAVESAEHPAQKGVDRLDGEPADRQADEHARREVHARQAPRLANPGPLPLRHRACRQLPRRGAASAAATW